MNKENGGGCCVNKEEYFNIPLDSEGRNILTGSIKDKFTCKIVEVFKATV